MSDKFRDDFKRTLRQTINKTTQPALGVEVTAVDIGKIRCRKKLKGACSTSGWRIGAFEWLIVSVKR